jgi:hypothetical protein
LSDANKQVCPWCQTEIIWDPETGPEEECPNCFNELRDYRSITLTTGSDADSQEEDEEEDTDVEDLRGDEVFDEEEYRDAYSEKAEEIIDSQEEAPECSNCRELMLFGGTAHLSREHFVPVRPAALGKDLLPDVLELNVYVCPSCYKTDTYLAESGRLRLTKVLGG